MKYLRTLEDWFDKLNDDGDFPKLLEVQYRTHIMLRKRSLRKTGRGSQGNDRLESRYTEVSVERAPSHIRNPAPTCFNASSY